MAPERTKDAGVNVSAVLTGAAVIVAAIALSLLSAWAIVAALGGAVHSRSPDLARVPPPPLLEAHPKSDRAAYEAAEQRRLSGYGWIDRDRGVVRIPVEVAMARLSERAGEGGERAQ
jgi:hypothetical protein